MVHSDLFIFDNVICITLKVPSIRILLSIGSLNGKNRFPEGQPRFFISNFPFVNLQDVHSITEKSFLGSLQFLQICWSELVGAIDFLEAVAQLI